MYLIYKMEPEEHSLPHFGNPLTSSSHWIFSPLFRFESTGEDYFVLRSNESTSKLGYDIDRFTEVPRSDFKCPVCWGVVRSPKECANCGVLICHQCSIKCVASLSARTSILSPERKKFSCPICRTNQSVIEPSKRLTNIINKLTLTCKHKNYGCTAVSSIQDIKAHQKVCPFRPVTCANKQCCNRMGPKQDFISFTLPKTPTQWFELNEAPIELAACSNACKRTIIFEDSLKRNSTEVLRSYYMLLQEAER